MGLSIMKLGGVILGSDLARSSGNSLVVYRADEVALGVGYVTVGISGSYYFGGGEQGKDLPGQLAMALPVRTAVTYLVYPRSKVIMNYGEPLLLNLCGITSVVPLYSFGFVLNGNSCRRCLPGLKRTSCGLLIRMLHCLNLAQRGT